MLLCRREEHNKQKVWSRGRPNSLHHLKLCDLLLRRGQRGSLLAAAGRSCRSIGLRGLYLLRRPGLLQLLYESQSDMDRSP